MSIRLSGMLRPVAATRLALGTLATGAIIWAGVSTAARSASASSSAMAPAVMTAPAVEPLTSVELAVALGRVGIDAEALAASGAGSQQVAALIGSARGHLTDRIQALRDADAAVVGATAERDRLQRLVRSGLGSAEDITALGAARAALSSALAAQSAQLQEVFEAAAQQLTSEQQERIGTIRANKSWGLPVQYLASSRTESEWIGLRDALANDRISVALGEEPDPAAHQVLLSAQGQHATASAATGLQTRLTEVTQAWDAALDF